MLKIYIEFLDNTIQPMVSLPPYKDNNLDFYGCLFDTLVGEDGNLSSCNINITTKYNNSKL